MQPSNANLETNLSPERSTPNLNLSLPKVKLPKLSVPKVLPKLPKPPKLPTPGL